MILSLAASLASAFQTDASPRRPPSPPSTAAEYPCARRVLLQRTATASLGGFLASLVSAAAPAGADVVRAPGCTNGEGEGCDDLAGDNDLIRSLQRKSAENREANQRVGGLPIKGDFGLVGWAAVAVILNDLTSSYLEKRKKR